MRIVIRWSSGEMAAELRDTPTAREIVSALPVESNASTWGEEVYFRFPVGVDLEPDAREVVDPGTVCYWVEGSSLALPYGRTPASLTDECRLANACNVAGKLLGDPRTLATVRDGEAIRVEIAPEGS
jgi:hypothetical protein